MRTVSFTELGFLLRPIGAMKSLGPRPRLHFRVMFLGLFLAPFQEGGYLGQMRYLQNMREVLVNTSDTDGDF